MTVPAPRYLSYHLHLDLRFQNERYIYGPGTQQQMLQVVGSLQINRRLSSPARELTTAAPSRSTGDNLLQLFKLHSENLPGRRWSKNENSQCPTSRWKWSLFQVAT